MRARRKPLHIRMGADHIQGDTRVVALTGCACTVPAVEVTAVRMSVTCDRCLAALRGLVQSSGSRSDK